MNDAQIDLFTEKVYDLARLLEGKFSDTSGEDKPPLKDLYYCDTEAPNNGYKSLKKLVTKLRTSRLVYRMRKTKANRYFQGYPEIYACNYYGGHYYVGLSETFMVCCITGEYTFNRIATGDENGGKLINMYYENGEIYR